MSFIVLLNHTADHEENRVSGFFLIPCFDLILWRTISIDNNKHKEGELALPVVGYM